MNGNNNLLSNHTALGRMLLVFKADLGTLHTALIGLAVFSFVVTCVLPRLLFSDWDTLYGNQNQYYGSMLYTMQSMMRVFLFGMSNLWFLWYFNRRLHDLQPMPWSLVPARLREKVGAMLGIFIVFQLITLLVQLGVNFVDYLLVEQASFNNPFSLSFLEEIGLPTRAEDWAMAIFGIITSPLIALFAMVRFQKYVVALILSFIGSTLLGSIFINLGKAMPEEAGYVAIVIFATISAVLVVQIYRSLKASPN